MLQKRFKILFAASSLFLCSCVPGPVVVVCISDPTNSGFRCVDKDGKPFFLKYADSNNYVAFSPDDTQKIIDYCKLKK